jgi:hypothetical protein
MSMAGVFDPRRGKFRRRFRGPDTTIATSRGGRFVARRKDDALIGVVLLLLMLLLLLFEEEQLRFSSRTAIITAIGTEEEHVTKRLLDNEMLRSSTADVIMVMKEKKYCGGGVRSRPKL